MLCVLFAFALAYDSEHRQCASQLAGCSFSLPLRSLYIPLFSFLMISSSAKDFGNRRVRGMKRKTDKERDLQKEERE